MDLDGDGYITSADFEVAGGMDLNNDGVIDSADFKIARGIGLIGEYVPDPEQVLNVEDKTTTTVIIEDKTKT